MATTHVDAVHHEAHENRDKLYVFVAIGLALLTVVEVLTYATPDIFPGGKGSGFIIFTLMLLMAVKFWVVAWFFMHLKFDKRLLTVVFYSGLILAVAVYCAVLAAFRFWGPPQDHMVAN